MNTIGEKRLDCHSLWLYEPSIMICSVVPLKTDRLSPKYSQQVAQSSPSRPANWTKWCAHRGQEDLICKLKSGKAGMKNKGLRVDMKKTTFLVSGVGHDVLQLSGECFCAVCCNCIGRNSILCPQCILWVHKTCSGIITRLVEEQNNICRMCKGEYLPIKGRTVTEWMSTAPCLMWKSRSAA